MPHRVCNVWCQHQRAYNEPFPLVRSLQIRLDCFATVMLERKYFEVQNERKQNQWTPPLHNHVDPGCSIRFFRMPQADHVKSATSPPWPKLPSVTNTIDTISNLGTHKFCSMQCGEERLKGVGDMILCRCDSNTTTTCSASGAVRRSLIIRTTSSWWCPTQQKGHHRCGIHLIPSIFHHRHRKQW